MIVNSCDKVNSRRHRQGSWLVDPGHKGSAALEGVAGGKGCQVVRESEQKSSSNANHMIIPVPTAGICAPLISRLHSHAQLTDICHKGMFIIIIIILLERQQNERSYSSKAAFTCPIPPLFLPI